MEKNQNIKIGKLKSRKIIPNADSYDLQTVTKNFIANGIVVHNSEIVLRPNQVCNLTEVIIRAGDTKETLLRKIELATILGTIQSTLTDFRYVRNVWRTNSEEERLLGVSLTGIMDHKTLSKYSTTAKSWLNEMRDKAVETNLRYSELLGITQSAAITTVKPSGCTTLDTAIKTEFGPMTMAEIFYEFADTENLFDLPPDTWVDLNGPIRVYDESNVLQNVTKLYVNGLAPVYEVEFEDGTRNKFTGNHKLKTTSGWKRVDELTEDDEIVSY